MQLTRKFCLIFLFLTTTRPYPLYYALKFSESPWKDDIAKFASGVRGALGEAQADSTMRRGKKIELAHFLRCTSFDPDFDDNSDEDDLDGDEDAHAKLSVPAMPKASSAPAVKQRRRKQRRGDADDYSDRDTSEQGSYEGTFTGTDFDDDYGDEDSGEGEGDDDYSDGGNEYDEDFDGDDDDGGDDFSDDSVIPESPYVIGASATGRRSEKELLAGGGSSKGTYVKTPHTLRTDGCAWLVLRSDPTSFVASSELWSSFSHGEMRAREMGDIQ